MVDPQLPRSPEPRLDDGESDTIDFRPRRRGNLSLSVTFIGLALAAFLLFDMREDLGFWFGGGAQVVDLGGPDTFNLDHLSDDVVATVKGTPGPIADRFRRLTERYEIVAIKGTPILVRRAVTGEELPLPPGKLPPPPDQATFTATGRLLRDTTAPAYQHAYQALAERGDALPRDDHLWLLVDGERPWTGWQTPIVLLALVGLLGLNVFTLVRHYRRTAEKNG
jgi:hypothetical protein